MLRSRLPLIIALAAALATTACTTAPAQSPGSGPEAQFQQPAQLDSGGVELVATIKPIAKVYLSTTTAVNLRASATTSSRLLKTVPLRTVLTSTQSTSNGWYRVVYAGKTGWISARYVLRMPGGVLNVGLIKGTTKEYVTTQNGAKDRWFTLGTAKVTWKGKSFTVPAGTPIWRLGSAGKGVWKVNGGGYRNATMSSAKLSKTSPARTSNTSKISMAAFKKLAAGSVSTAQLARINFGTQALIGAPAVADLNALNVAFKKRFGEDLYIDLGYRSASQQRMIYNELGGRIAAKPGTSIHEKGLSFDTPEHGTYSWSSARFKWLKANAPKFGWQHPARVERYLPNGKLNPSREYWHFDYVGKGK